MISFFASLSWKQARLAVLSALFFGIVLNLIQISSDYINEVNSLNDNLVEKFIPYSKSSSKIAYNLDKTLAKELVTDLLTYKFVLKVALLDDQKNILFKGANHIAPEKSLLEHLMSTYFLSEIIIFNKELFDGKNAKETVGYLEITVDSYYFFEDFLHRSISIFYYGIVKSFLLTFVLLFLFNHFLTKPIIKLSKNIWEFRIKTEDKPVLSVFLESSFDKYSNKDELERLILGTNKLIGTIKETFAEKDIVTKKLKLSQQNLKLKVIERTNLLEQANKDISDLLAKSNVKIEKERHQIAECLHDNVNPKLILLKLEIQKNIMSRKKNSFNFQKILNIIDDIYSEIRSVINLTRIEIIGSIGIISAIKHLISQYKESTDIDFVLDNKFFIEKKIEQQQAINVFRIVQEAMLNAVKYSDATLIKVRLRHKNDLLIVSVKDNGKGILISGTRGVGMIDMKERAKSLGSKLKIKSNKNGTQIYLRIKNG